MRHFIILLSILLTPAASLAQSGGLTIEHSIPDRAVAGEPLQFAVSVSGAENLAALDLYYRRSGEPAFSRLPMTTSDGRLYTATVPGPAVTGVELEYYIEALDSDGNLTVRGGKRFPLLVSVVAPTRTAGERSSTPDTSIPKPSQKSSNSNVWKWVLGALAVGAVAALAGGGGDDSNDASAPPVTSTALTFTDAPAP